ncbi:uncharacterized protein [Acropora muricata]|uniref:uncharacterized protein n=1 Tax=Acropora muricata TaxID=159855 RepID=UPI0034E4DD7B
MHAIKNRASDVTERKGGKKSIDEEGKQYGGNGGKDYGKHRTILRDYRSIIVKNLEPNNILPKLVTVLTEKDVAEIREQSTRQERCERLLEILPRKGPNGFTVFVEALKEEAPHLASDLIDAASDVTERKGGKKSIDEEGKQYGGNGGKDYGKHRTILRDYRSIIVKNLEPNNILSKLVTVLTEKDVAEIREQSTRQERCERLLEILPRKGPNGFTVFVEALKEEAPHLASDLIDAARAYE